MLEIGYFLGNTSVVLHLRHSSQSLFKRGRLDRQIIPIGHSTIILPSSVALTVYVFRAQQKINDNANRTSKYT